MADVLASYDPSLPDALSRIRFALGDTDTAPGMALLSDTAILGVLASEGNDETKATAKLAGWLAGHYAMLPDRVTRGDSTVEWKSRVTALQALAAGSTGASGGYSVTPGRA